MPLAFDPYDYYGRPELLDEFGVQLSKLAAEVGNGSDAITRRIEAMGFEGPKAEQIRERATEGRRSAQEIVDRLQALSFSVFNAAAYAREKIHELEMAELRAQQAMYPPGYYPP